MGKRKYLSHYLRATRIKFSNIVTDLDDMACAVMAEMDPEEVEPPSSYKYYM